MWWRIYTVIIKEMQIILRDKRTRIILILPPILQIFIFAFASTLEIKNISFGIFNQDAGTRSVELIQEFQDSPSFAHLQFLHSAAEAKEYVDTQKGIGVLHIDSEFSRKIAAGEPVKIQLIFDGRKTNVAQIVNGYIHRMVQQYNQSLIPGVSIHPDADIPVVRHWYNPNLEYLYFTIPCLIANICMIMGITIPALSVAREREFGTFDQILVSPLSTLEMLVGKTVPSLIVGFFQATGMILVAIVFFRIPFTGSLLMLYTGMIVFVASIIGVGLFISSLCKTQQQAILGAFVFTVPAVLISGYATPIENMPEWLQQLSRLNPVRYFMVVIKGVFLKDMSWSIAWNNLLPLLLLTASSLTFAGWLFKKKLD